MAKQIANHETKIIAASLVEHLIVKALEQHDRKYEIV